MSRSTLRNILHPLSPPEFFAKTWGKEPRVFPGDSRRFSRIFSWGVLNRILSERPTHQLPARVARRGETIRISDLAASTSRATLRHHSEHARLLSALRSGYSLVLDGADALHLPLRHFVSDIAHDIGESVQANIYASWTRTRGFATHWDDHDVFVLQISGKKRWRIFAPSIPHPVALNALDGSPPPARARLRPMLSPGDVLYIPRGWWHDAIPVAGASLHVTLATRFSNGIDLLRWIVESLHDQPFFRRDIPRFSSAETRNSYLAELRSRATEIIGSRSLEAYFMDTAAKDTSVAEYCFPHGITSEHPPHHASDVINWLPIRTIIPSRDHANNVIFRANGKSWKFDFRSGPLLTELIKCRRLRYSSATRLSPLLSSAQLGEFLNNLIVHGLISIRSRPHRNI